MYRPAHLEEGRTHTVFPKPVRVKIFLFLQDVWKEYKDAWHWLHEIIKRALGKLELGHGNDPEEKIKHFILAASDEDFLGLLKHIPFAEFKVYDELCNKRTNNPFGIRSYGNLDTHLKDLAEGLNDLLSQTQCAARFEENGDFNESPWAENGPQSSFDLPTKKNFYDELDIFLADNEVITVLEIDLDGFKAVNDNYGHQMGDECLEQYINIIKNCINMKGKLYQYGGDEMAVIFRNFQFSEARPVAERIRKEIDENEFTSGIHLTVSIGIACNSEIRDATAKSLFDAADQALYRSKEEGKNRITVYSE